MSRFRLECVLPRIERDDISTPSVVRTSRE
jgi:hypothetical protein